LRGVSNFKPAGRRPKPGGPCLCQGLGPALTEFLRRVGPPEEARRHFDSARVEILKGLRAILEARIQQATGASARGQKIKVE
jgi:hypothetical protein